MIYLTKILSLDIRDQLISIAYLGRSLKGVTYLIDSAVIPKKPVPVSSIKKDGENEFDPELLANLSSFINDKKISPEETIICAPRNIVMCKFIDIPSPDEASIPNILRYELDRLVPMDPSEIYYDYQLIGKGRANHFKIFLAVAPKHVAGYYVEMLKKVGLSPTALNISTFGSYNQGYYSDHDLSKSLAIIDVGVKEFEIILIENNAVKFTRSFKVTTGEWEECFLKGGGALEDSGKVMESLAQNILNNLWQSVRSAHEREELGELKRIFLIGGGKSGKSLLDNLRKGTDLDVDTLAPSKKSMEFKKDTDEAATLSTAIGLGLGELKKTPMDVNLLPLTLRAKRKKSQTLLTIGLISVIFLSLMGILGSVIIKDRILLAETKEKLESAKKRVKEVEEMEVEYAQIAGQLSGLSEIWKQDINLLDVLKELTSILPGDTWLNSLNVKENAVDIGGRSRTASSLIPIIDKSPLFEDVRFEGSIESKKGIEKFKIKMVVKK